MKNIFKVLIICLIYCLFCEVKAQDTLSLEKAIEIALAKNFDIQIARNEALAARKANTPGNAGFLPNLQAGLNQQNNVNTTKQEFFSGDIREGNNVKSNTLNAGVQLQWTIFDGLNMFITRQKLTELEKMGELGLRLQVENTVYSVMMLYYSAVLEQKKLEVIRQAVDISRERKMIAVQRQLIGSGSGLEVLQASVDLNADSSALLRQQNQLLDVIIAFNEVLTNNPETSFMVSQTITLNENLIYQDLLAKLREQNPEISLAKSKATLEMLNVKQQRSGLMPNVAFNSGYSLQHSESELGIIKYGQNSGVYYGLTAGWTLFDGFNRQRQVQIARITLANRELEQQQTEMRLQNELYRIFSIFRTRLELLSKEKANLEVAKESLFVAKEKMRIGSISALELREAQRALVEAEFRRIQAEFEAKIAETHLLQLTGNLLSVQF
jgi:outer membrane protein TolC